MRIRKTKPDELDTVMALYDVAREYMSSQGNPNQWINGYPWRDLIAREIDEGNSYVCEDNGEIAAVFSLLFGEEPEYQTIYDGAWLNDRPYATLHRICVGRHGGGIAAYCLQWCLEQSGNLRVDTHRDNRPMRTLLERNGFQHCGRIVLSYGDDRLAYQKTL